MKTVNVQYPKMDNYDNSYGRNGESYDTQGYCTSRCYSFFTEIEDLKPGDLVVVPYANPNHNRFVVCRVAGYAPSAKATKWVVQRLDVEAFAARVEAAKELEALQKEFFQKVAEAQKQVAMEELVVRFPQLAELKERLDNLAKLVT